MNSNTKNFLLAFFLVLLGVAFRLVPHPANFVPISALALLSARFLPRSLGFGVPLLAMLISDLFIGFYETPVMIAVYGSFALIWLIGRMNVSASFLNVIPKAMAGAILFFFLTNFAVWAYGGLYAHTAAGLFEAYVMAIPFFKMTLLGDVFYTVLFFGGYKVYAQYLEQKFFPLTDSGLR